MNTLQQIKEDIENGHLVSPIIVYERVLKAIEPVLAEVKAARAWRDAEDECDLSDGREEAMEKLVSSQCAYSEARKASEEAGF